MTDNTEALPPLPLHFTQLIDGTLVYTAEQVREAQRAAIAQRRQAAPSAQAEPQEPLEWISDRLPPRYKLEHFSETVIAIAETDDACLQMIFARVEYMSKGEWREVRFDHDGLGRKIVVRCWTPAPKFPKKFPSSGIGKQEGK